MVGVDVKGVLVCDKNGLPLTTKDVSISPGPISRLAELASSLSGRRTTVCLEHNEAYEEKMISFFINIVFFSLLIFSQVIIHQTDKTVVAVYTTHGA